MKSLLAALSVLTLGTTTGTLVSSNILNTNLKDTPPLDNTVQTAINNEIKADFNHFVPSPSVTNHTLISSLAVEFTDTIINQFKDFNGGVQKGTLWEVALNIKVDYEINHLDEKTVTIKDAKAYYNVDVLQAYTNIDWAKYLK